jgi:hypothetical protein
MLPAPVFMPTWKQGTRFVCWWRADWPLPSRTLAIRWQRARRAPGALASRKIWASRQPVMSPRGALPPPVCVRQAVAAEARWPGPSCGVVVLLRWSTPTLVLQDPAVARGFVSLMGRYEVVRCLVNLPLCRAFTWIARIPRWCWKPSSFAMLPIASLRFEDDPLSAVLPRSFERRRPCGARASVPV